MVSGSEARAAVPYGPLGLVLSLVVWVLLTAVICGFFGAVLALADAALFGWSHMSAAIQTLRTGGGAQSSTGLPTFVYAFAIALYAAMAAAILSLARFRGGADWRRLVAWRVEWPWWCDRLYWLLVVGAIVYGAAASALLSKFYPPSNQWLVLPQGLTAALLVFCVAVLAAPLAEELLFRGWIFTSLRSRFGSTASIVVSALLFALAHYERTHLYALAVLPVGLILGIVRERTGTMWATAVLHVLYNFSAWFLTAFGPN